MIEPKPQASPYDSCHHKDTSLGDTFGGLGTDREYREESVRAQLQRHSDGFPNHGTTSTSANPPTRVTPADLLELNRKARAEGLAFDPPDPRWVEYNTHESTHDKP